MDSPNAPFDALPVEAVVTLRGSPASHGEGVMSPGVCVRQVQRAVSAAGQVDDNRC